jgi:hypothetical protein
MSKQAFLNQLINQAPHLFWDVPVESLSYTNSKQLIIERVLNRGDLPDLTILKKIYTQYEIKEAALRSGYLNAKTINWLSLIWKLDKTSFKCYIKQQSNPVHWN